MSVLFKNKKKKKRRENRAVRIRFRLTLVPFHSENQPDSFLFKVLFDLGFLRGLFFGGREEGGGGMLKTSKLFVRMSESVSWLKVWLLLLTRDDVYEIFRHR